jgi:hypothetical protein
VPIEDLDGYGPKRRNQASVAEGKASFYMDGERVSRSTMGPDVTSTA